MDVRAGERRGTRKGREGQTRPDGGQSPGTSFTPPLSLLPQETVGTACLPLTPTPPVPSLASQDIGIPEDKA